MKRRIAAVCALALSTALGSAASGAGELLRLATTTSTENSGLLAHLLPRFQQATGYEVHVIAVGTGKALKLGQNGDVDVVLVHARQAEDAFVDAGHGVERRAVMYNDFVLVGPADDPAGIGQAKDTVEALSRIAGTSSRFISRGDDSGTHKKELSLWAMAKQLASGAWYIESGQGMGKVLNMASELDAYTLTDRGTWLALRNNLRLALLFENDPPLHNPYSIIAVNPERHPHVDVAGTKAFIEWLISAPTQKLIGEYRVDGEVLFHPLVEEDKES